MDGGVACFHGMAYWPCREYILPKFHLQVQNVHGSNLRVNNDLAHIKHVIAGNLNWWKGSKLEIDKPCV
jgi:hypothetical protein